ncbi:MAG TPA: hypothetical protein VM864_06685 [Pyrinomonadaceae bacterium]|jgi:hypothetical protein|nr:hypothetical protein [Pyrinomonadaceae bacterium]
MNRKKLFNSFAALVVALTATLASPAFASDRKSKESGAAAEASVRTPLNLAVLVQDDLVSRVGGELGVTRAFIRALPAGSRVMVGYLTSGSLQVRQQFTDDLDKAARSLRIPVASESAAPFNPYVELIEALKKFDAQGKNRNAVLLISDGLDVSRGFDSSSSVNSFDLQRAIREARKRGVAVYTFYAPAVGLTSRNSTAVSYGQSSLSRLAKETGGEAFFQGTSFVTFDAYFVRLGRALNGSSTAY